MITHITTNKTSIDQSVAGDSKEIAMTVTTDEEEEE